MKLSYIKGDATKPQGDGKKLILHICNDEGGWGSGFVLGLNKTFGTQENSPCFMYRQWYGGVADSRTGPFKLGQIQFCKQPDNVTVVNMIAQSTPGGYKGFPPIRYQSLEECLLRLRDTIKPALNKGTKVSLHGPRFGSGLAGGDWNEIEKIIKRVFADVDVSFTIYDFE